MIIDPYGRVTFSPGYTESEEYRTRLVKWRSYQEVVFFSNAGVLVLHWGRRLGKSFTLGAWAVKRCLENPGRLVTVLSNSKQNGIEFIGAAAKYAELTNAVLASKAEFKDESDGDLVENMRMEIRFNFGDGIVSRILVLAANPRTARGFGGDLILDEFAFQEDSEAIWDAAAPIFSENKDYACRVASTGNGRFNMFYKMANPGSDFLVSRIRRSEAYRMGVPIYHPVTRREITPDEARAESMDKASYDQNYECSFCDDNAALLTFDLIEKAEYLVNDDRTRECFICSQEWTFDALKFMENCRGPMCYGVDIGRNRDLTVIVAAEKVGGCIFVRGVLRMANMRGQSQLKEFRAVFGMRNFGRACLDRTGIGQFLVEFAQDLPGVGQHRAEAVHFASREPRENKDGLEREDTGLVTELMAMDLLRVFEGTGIKIPNEREFRDSLRKPERIATSNGVKIAATRDEAGHADEFWALALLVRAMKVRESQFAYEAPVREPSTPFLSDRHDRRLIALV